MATPVAKFSFWLAAGTYLAATGPAIPIDTARAGAVSADLTRCFLGCRMEFPPACGSGRGRPRRRRSAPCQGEPRAAAGAQSRPTRGLDGDHGADAAVQRGVMEGHVRAQRDKYYACFVNFLIFGHALH